MKLHVRECPNPQCRRFAIRIEGEQQWCQYMNLGGLDGLKRKHEIVSHIVLDDPCTICQRKIISDLANTAGANH